MLFHLLCLFPFFLCAADQQDCRRYDRHQPQCRQRHHDKDQHITKELSEVLHGVLEGTADALPKTHLRGHFHRGILPQIYIIYLSFRNSKGSLFGVGYSLINYQSALKKKLVLASRNTLVMGIIALAVIIVIAVVLAYLVVRRNNALNHSLDTIAMLPYIMPGAVIGIALLIAYGSKPIALTGTMAIMIMSFAIRRMPYTIRSATATLMQIPISIEEAAISLGASKLKTFVKITVPMMSNGILSGAILSWVAIVTELSSSVILYSNKTTTLTMQAYIYIGRGEYGTAAAFAAILTVITALSLFLYMAISKSEDDIQL